MHIWPKPSSARERLVGYRLVGAGPDSDPLEHAGVTAWDAAGPDGPVRLLRGPAVDPVVEALLTAAGPHVLPLLDVGTAPNGDTVAVVPALPHTLTEVLAAGPLPPGAAATVLVPIVQAVGRLHAAGVAHGALAVASVQLDEVGAPLLTGFASATLRSRVTAARFETAVEADLTALDRLVTQLLPEAARVRPNGARHASADLVEALFDVADPVAVPLDRQRGEDHEAAPPGRIIPLGAARSAPAPAGATPRSRAAELLGRVRGALGSVRHRVWLAAGAVVLALIAALVLLPGHGAEAEPAPSPAADSRPAPRPQHSTPSAVPADPAAALPVLVRERAACLGAGDERCLTDAEQSGSPLASQDASAIRAGVPGVAVPTGPVRVRARSGTTATLSAGRTTILLIRQDGAWHLRDISAPAE